MHRFANVRGLYYHSLVDQINTKEMGRAKLYASFVNSIVTILSKSSIMQCHYNDILQMCSKNKHGRFYRDLASKPSQPIS